MAVIQRLLNKTAGSAAKRGVNIAYPLGAVVIMLALWSGVVTLWNIPEYVLPLPLDIFREIFKWGGMLLKHTLVTASEALIGFLLAVIAGYLLSLLIVWSRTVERTVLPIVVFVQSTPKVALAPLFMIWFGFGDIPKILIATLIAFFPVLINAIRGLASVESDMLDLVDSMAASKWQVFTKVRIPNSLPYLFTGMRISIVLAVVGAIVGEFVGANAGLGYLILIANANLQTTLMFSAIVLLALMGATFFYTLVVIEKLAMPWKPVEAMERTVTTA